MQFPSAEIQEYLQDLTPERSALLKEMEALAEEENFPAVGPQVGGFLYQLAKISHAKMIFELGSGFGYSAVWFASALPDDGQMICTEFDHAKAKAGLQFLKRAKVKARVLYEVGDALTTFKNYQGPFDLIFVDLNKEQYPEVIPLAERRLKPGGLLIADNVLWSGRVLDPEDNSKATEGIRAYNRTLAEHPGFFTTIIPLRDGVSVSLKK